MPEILTERQETEATEKPPYRVLTLINPKNERDKEWVKVRTRHHKSNYGANREIVIAATPEEALKLLLQAKTEGHPFHSFIFDINLTRPDFEEFGKVVDEKGLATPSRERFITGNNSST